jgi:uncharacterized protein
LNEIVIINGGKTETYDWICPWTNNAWAVDMGRKDVVRWLVDAKVDLNSVDKYGQTALILAAGRNDCESIQILIGAKADVNIKMVTGETALGKALENKKNEAAALLKKAGAK